MRRLLVLAALASCAAPPPPSELEFEVPQEWTTASARPGKNPEKWWELFGDDRLNAVVFEALTKNPSVRGAAARIDAAVAQARIAGSDIYPQASARADVSERKQVFLGISLPGTSVLSSTFTSYGVSLDLSWEIDLWGRLRHRHSAALADVQAHQADFAGALLSLAAQTSKAYFAAVESQRQLELARSTVESYRAGTERIRDRFQRGLRPALDLRLAEAALASAESTLHLREEQLDRHLRQLETLLGRFPHARVPVASELVGVPGPVPAGLPSELLRRRPDLVAAERRFASAGARLAESRASLFPRLSLTASGGNSTDELKNLVDPDYLIWSLAANLFAPIFQGGRLRAGVDLSAALRDQASARFIEVALQAFADVQIQLAAEDILRRREEATRAFAEHSRAALEISENRYAAGLIDIVTLLETQRRAYAAESELLSVRRQRLDARVNLHLALGGGFEWK